MVSGEDLFRSLSDIAAFVIDTKEDMARLLKAIDHPHRLDLLARLLREPKQLWELADETELHKSLLTNHLQQLTEAGLVMKMARGLYGISRDGVDLLEAVTKVFLESKMREQRRFELKQERYKEILSRYTTIHTVMTMNDIEVRIVRLDPMRVASVQAISESPEPDAWKKLGKWARAKGLLADLQKHPVFGFNDPNPTVGEKVYGYEFWIRIEDDTEIDDDQIQVKEFEGGLYAVARCVVQNEEMPMKEGMEVPMFSTWEKLVTWVQKSKYDMGKHQCLEKTMDPDAEFEDLILDLYCPIQG